MSLLIAAALAGSTILNAVTSKNAADAQADGVNKSIKSTTELSNRARDDAMKLYSSGMLAGRKASQKVIDFYTSSIPNVIKPMQQGNVLGQKTLYNGMNQANNALLGLPVDTSFAAPQQINADYGFLKNVPSVDQGATPAGTDPTVLIGENRPLTAQQVAGLPYNAQAYHPDGFNPVNAGLEAYYASIKKPTEQQVPASNLQRVDSPVSADQNPVNSALLSYYAGNQPAQPAVAQTGRSSPGEANTGLTEYYKNVKGAN